MNKLYALVLSLVIGITVICLINTIEKHSVHPIYGNYVKKDCDDKPCKPWDYCPPS